MSFSSPHALAALIAVAALSPQGVRAAGLELQGDVIDLALRATAANPEAPALDSQAQLTAQIANLQTRAQFGFGLGSKAGDAAQTWPYGPPAESGWWNTRQLSLGATWNPSALAKLELAASSQDRTEFDRTAALSTATTTQSQRSRQETARAALTLTPWTPVNLQIGAQASDNLVETTTATAEVPTASDLRTQSRQAFATVTWKLLPQLSLEGGGKTEVVDIAWQGTGALSGSYAFVEPRLATTLTPWSGASWRFGVERAVAPLNTGQFVTFAQAAESATGQTGALFNPDQEWRYQAAFQQKILGDIDLNATLTRARLLSVTDLGPVGAGQAPMDIGGGVRRQIEASLATPLDLFGLPGLNLKAKAAWRSSQVLDPFSRTLRPISGETPYDAQLTLAGAAGPRLQWGVTAQAAGPSTVFQMSQITTQSAMGGIGGYLEYEPGPLKIRLNMDNLLGGDRTTQNLYYTGSRAYNPVDRIDQSRVVDRAVRIVFSRPL